MNAFERPDILLTITLVIAERGDHPLKITDLIDLVCACDRGFRPASALEIVREWIRLEVLLREENGFTIDPEVAVELFETTHSCLTEAQRSTWIRTRAAN